MKLLLVTSKYRPQMCGVGDYSALLVDHLRGLGYSVDIFTSGVDHEQHAEPGVFQCAAWSLGTVRDLAQRVREEKYTHVLLQYTPMGFSRKGAFPPIALLPRLVRRSAPQCRVITTLHELFYVTRFSELARIPRNLTIGTMQRVLLTEVARHSSALVVTTEERRRFVARLGKLLGWRNNKNIYEIPVGTNIASAPLGVMEGQALKERLGLVGKVILGTFSKASDPIMLLAALAAARSAGHDAYLLAVGADTACFLGGAAKRYRALSPYVICTGKAAPEDVSRHLQLMDIYLLPLLDGISARRGTLLAALAHSLPIVGTAGRSTDPWMRESPAFCLTPAGRTQTFENAVLSVLKSQEQQRSLRCEAAALFGRRFTWQAIAKSYQDILETLAA